MVDNQFIKAVEYLKNSGAISSQKELCEILGYKQQAFTEIMQGRSKVNTSLIQDFCKKYNVSLDWLFYNEGEMIINDEDIINNFNNGKMTNNGNNKSVNGDITVNASEHKTLISEVEFLRGQIIKKDEHIGFLQGMLNKFKK